MSFFRKAFTVALLGLILGTAAGTGFAYWRRVTQGSIVMTTGSPDGSLTLRCTNGTAPTIHVTWPAKITSLISDLERSIDGGAWQKLYPTGAKPLATGYRDTNVVLGHQYQYRVRLFEKGPFTSATIMADQSTCQ